MFFSDTVYKRTKPIIYLQKRSGSGGLDAKVANNNCEE